jgi:3'(2'), 5'-bisphosphate nucleotidase
MAYLSELHIALAAVREAAELCGEVQQQMDPGAIEKKDRSPVTVADFGSQALICSRLRKAFPDDPIIAEETSATLRLEEGKGTADRVVSHVRMLRPEVGHEEVLSWIDMGNHKAHAPRYWTLDPIDGTKGFLRGDQYAVALALVVDAQVVVAAVACPNLTLERYPDQKGVVAGAIRGQVTTLYRLQDMEPMGPASVTTTADPSEARFSESVESAHTSHSQSALISRLLGITRPATRLDSQAKYVVVAAGDADIYLRLPSDRRYIENIWDHAAGMLLVQEAGGRVTDTRGADLDFGYGYQLLENRGILVTNGHLHPMMLRAIADIASGEEDPS